MRSRVLTDVLGSIGWPAALAVVCLVLGSAHSAQGQLSITNSPPPGTCLGGTCSQRPPPVVLLPVPNDVPGLCTVSRVAALAGIAASAASIGGSVAIGLDDDMSRRRVTSGVYAGATLLFAPLVALGAFSARKHCHVTGHPPSRLLGWIGYSGALATALLAFSQTLRDEPPNLALTIGIGGIGTFGLLPHAFDAFMGSRQARAPSLGLRLGAVSRLVLTF